MDCRKAVTCPHYEAAYSNAARIDLELLREMVEEIEALGRVTLPQEQLQRLGSGDATAIGKFLAKLGKATKQETSNGPDRATVART